MAYTSEKITFTNASGNELDGVFEKPDGPIYGYALYAHCFTCSKEIAAAVRVSRALAEKNIATLRFDFSGIGRSGGKFGDTTFTSDIGDIIAGADYMRQHNQAPDLLIGHSLGGAAILGAAADVPEAKAVATIAAPSEPAHVQHLFEKEIDRILAQGKAAVDLGGRKMEISQEFVEDVRGYDLKSRIANMKKALLILHSPTDQTVGIENAKAIYEAAKHPKSFITLDGADHLLMNKDDAQYAASIMAIWATRYIDRPSEELQSDAA